MAYWISRPGTGVRNPNRSESEEIVRPWSSHARVKARRYNTKLYAALLLQQYRTSPAELLAEMQLVRHQQRAAHFAEAVRQIRGDNPSAAADLESIWSVLQSTPLSSSGCRRIELTVRALERAAHSGLRAVFRYVEAVWESAGANGLSSALPFMPQELRYVVTRAMEWEQHRARLRSAPAKCGVKATRTPEIVHFNQSGPRAPGSVGRRERAAVEVGA